MACALFGALAGCSVLAGDGVRDQWEERSTLPTCGEVTLEQGERLQEKGRSEIACLRAAFNARQRGGTEGCVSHVEGDPITEYYRITSRRTTEIYIDSTQDRNSDQKWSFAQCEKPRPFSM